MEVFDAAESRKDREETAPSPGKVKVIGTVRLESSQRASLSLQSELLYLARGLCSAISKLARNPIF